MDQSFGSEREGNVKKTTKSKERTGEEMFKHLVDIGKERAAEERIEFVLTEKELFLIFKNHVKENKEYLTPSTVGYYEKLLIGAIVYVNRTMVTEKKSIQDALFDLNEFRSKTAKPNLARKDSAPDQGLVPDSVRDGLLRQFV